MVNNLVFRWPKPLFFMVLGAHGIRNRFSVKGGMSLSPIFRPWHISEFPVISESL